MLFKVFSTANNSNGNAPPETDNPEDTVEEANENAESSSAATATLNLLFGKKGPSLTEEVCEVIDPDHTLATTEEGMEESVAISHSNSVEKT